MELNGRRREVAFDGIKCNCELQLCTADKLAGLDTYLSHWYFLITFFNPLHRISFQNGSKALYWYVS